MYKLRATGKKLKSFFSDPEFYSYHFYEWDDEDVLGRLWLHCQNIYYVKPFISEQDEIHMIITINWYSERGSIFNLQSFLIWLCM